MAVTPRKAVSTPAEPTLAQDFIAGAPDAKPMVEAIKPIKKLGNKSIITLSIDPQVLARLDAWAKARGLSRAAAVSLAVSNLE